MPWDEVLYLTACRCPEEHFRNEMAGPAGGYAGMSRGLLAVGQFPACRPLQAAAPLPTKATSDPATRATSPANADEGWAGTVLRLHSHRASRLIAVAEGLHLGHFGWRRNLLSRPAGGCSANPLRLMTSGSRPLHPPPWAQQCASAFANADAGCSDLAHSPKPRQTSHLMTVLTG